jgi:hypothetical protein
MKEKNQMYKRRYIDMDKKKVMKIKRISWQENERKHFATYLDGFIVDERINSPVAGVVLSLVHPDSNRRPPLRHQQSERCVRGYATQRHCRELPSTLVILKRRSNRNLQPRTVRNFFH